MPPKRVEARNNPIDHNIQNRRRLKVTPVPKRPNTSSLSILPVSGTISGSSSTSTWRPNGLSMTPDFWTVGCSSCYAREHYAMRQNNVGWAGNAKTANVFQQKEMMAKCTVVVDARHLARETFCAPVILAWRIVQVLVFRADHFQWTRCPFIVHCPSYPIFSWPSRQESVGLTSLLASPSEQFAKLSLPVSSISQIGIVEISSFDVLAGLHGRLSLSTASFMRSQQDGHGNATGYGSSCLVSVHTGITTPPFSSSQQPESFRAHQTCTSRT